MASYSTMNTIPTADVSETPLLSRDIKVNAKTLLGGAAAAAFVLGAAAATVVAPAAYAPPADFHTLPADTSSKTQQIRLAINPTEGEQWCLKASDDVLQYARCDSTDASQSFYIDTEEKDSKIKSTETGLCVTRDGTVSTGNPGDNTYDKFIMGDCDGATTFRGIDYDVPTRLETTDKSCLQPITGPITIEGYTGVGMDVVGAGCEDRRKYQWWTLAEQPYDNVWHTSHTH